VQLHPEARSSVVFGNRNLGVEVTFSEIRGLHEYVRDSVFPKFFRFFEPGGLPELP
jgi:hypothetical protein